MMESMRMFPELDHTELLAIPADFSLLIGLAVGYPVSPLEKTVLRHEPIGTNVIR